MDMSGELEQALRDVRDKLLSNPVSPRVENPADINNHYCRYVAETVVDREGDKYDLQILGDGGRGFVHMWIACNGRHYDAECIEGVDDHRDLPFFQRHPEAVIHIEPGTANQAEIRNRGVDPLHPDIIRNSI